jgi:hypothetical protein
MSKKSNFKQLQNLILELGSIVADKDTFLTKVYTRWSGSYTRVTWRYNNNFFSVEYPNSHQDKRGLNNAYINTRKGLNGIGLSMEDMKSLAQDYIGKNVSVSVKLNQVWKCLENEKWGFLWWFMK